MTSVAALLVLLGCQATHVAYVHTTAVGVDLKAAPAEQGNIKLSIGYDRMTFALVPREDGSNDGDAMTVTSASRVEVNGLSTAKFGHLVATGSPAVQLATEPDRLGQLVKQFFADDPKPAQPNAAGARNGGGQ